MSEESVEQRIKVSKPVEDGWTNRVYHTPEGTIIKVFSTHIFEALIFAIADALHGKFNVPFRGERIRKEIDMKDYLADSGYAVPDIIQIHSNALEMEKIPGKSLKQEISSGPERLGRKIGKLLKHLHSEGCSLGDATFENFYINNDEVYTVDHEYGSLNSDFIDIERDMIHLLSDALEQESREYLKFRKGFEEKYREFNRPETIAATVFSSITAVLGLQPGKLKNTFPNAIRGLEF